MRPDSDRTISLASLAFLALALLLPLGPADAGDFAVDSTADAVDADPGNGDCKTVVSGLCTLRAAIQETNALAGADTITLDDDAYVLAIAGPAEDKAATGDLDITDDLTIKGGEGGTTIVNGADLDRIFDIISGTVDIARVTIQNGTSDDDGGGVRNSGDLTLSDSGVRGNTSPASGGGIVGAAGKVTLVGSLVEDNTAAANAGGIGVFSGATVLLTDSIVSGNIAAAFGGGILSNGSLTLAKSSVLSNASNLTGAFGGGGGGIYAGAGTLTLTNSSVSGNTAKLNGGGVFVGVSATITGSTITDNTADFDLNGSGAGGGIFMLAGSPLITNSSISGNSGGSDGGGIYVSSGVTTLTSSNVDGNNAGNGGGIRNFGTVTLTNSTLSGNSAPSGGGMRNNGTATLTNSTISGNSGGGLRNTGNSVTTLTNSTVSGNTSAVDGGGIFNNSAAILTLNNSTITNNTADSDLDGSGDGGGIYNVGIVNLKYTVLAGNFDLSVANVDPDCFGELTTQGYNLIGTISGGCTFVGVFNGNLIGPGANLGALAVNAPGTTKTHALLAGSSAIDAIAAVECPPPATDQRGVARPQGAACDMGAYEFQQPGDAVFGNGFE